MSETVKPVTVSINNLKSLSIHTIRVVQRLAEGSWLHGAVQIQAQGQADTDKDSLVQVRCQ